MKKPTKAPTRRSDSAITSPRSQLLRLALTSFLVPGIGYGANFVVDTTNDEPYGGGTLGAETADGNGLSLREAIGLANDSGGDDDGDTISFDTSLLLSGTTITLGGTQLEIADDVVIDGTLGLGLLDQITIDAAGSSRIFHVDTSAAAGSEAGVVLRDLTLINGSEPTSGGGIQVAPDAELTLERTDISGCLAGDGGGIYNDGGSVTVRNLTISGNTANAAAGSGGGIFNNTNGKLVIEDCEFDGNLANRAGGAIEDKSDGSSGFDVTISDTIFTDNRAGVAPAVAAPGNGGAIHITGSGSMSLTGCDASGNLAASEGGAYWNGAGLMEIDGGTINGNTASGAAADNGGGGIFNNGGTLTVGDATVTMNVADGASGSGGGVFSTAGAVSITDTEISANSANRAGGGIEIVDGSLTLTGVTLGGDDSEEGNVAGPPVGANPGNGGGLHISGSTVTVISGGLVGFNSAAREGGGLWNQMNSSMTVRGGAVIADNAGLGSAADDGGGGIFNNGGTLIVDDTDGAVTITRNTATTGSGSGGGVLNVSGGTLAITGATISANIANRAGGGIEDASGSANAVTLTNVLLQENLAGVAPATAMPGSGGGLHVTGPGGVSITGGGVSGNLAASEGGGLWNGTGTMTVSGTVVSNNTASGAAADQGGGGLFNAGGTLEITSSSSIDANIADGAAGSGGGVFNDAGGTLTIENTAISNNRANRAGGGLEDNSGTGTLVTLTNVIFDSNNAGVAPATAAPGNGGAIHISGAGDITIGGGSASGNVAATEGGAHWNGTGTMGITDSAISGNTASGAAADDGGGGVFNNGGTLTIGNTTITANVATGTAGSGGGILNVSGGTVSVTGSTISGNTANRAGGGIEDQSGLTGTAVTLTGVTMENNKAGTAPATPAPGNGGALHVTGTGGVEINGGTFRLNEAALEGGGLWNGTGTMTVDAATIDQNTATGAAADDGGGGIFNNGGVLIVRNGTVISANTATGAAGSGGGILNVTGGTVSIADSTLSANTSVRAGGGLEDQSGLSGVAITLNNATLTDNVTGGSPGNGGGLHVTGSGGVECTGGTVSGNFAAAEGGGLWNGTGTMTVNGTLVTDNTASGAAADQGGGGLFNAGGTLSVGASAVISGNLANGAAGSGGGIFNDASGILTVENSSIFGNTANRAGGALEVTGGTSSTLSGCFVYSNTAGPEGSAAPGNGGAVHISGDGMVETTGSHYDDNFAANEGGGLWNSGAGTLTVSASAITGNSSPDGGGLFNQAGSGQTTVANTTVSGNSATNGGGIRIEGGIMTLLHVTVAANQAGTAGGGADINAGTLMATNSIFADNGSAGTGPDVNGVLTGPMFTLLEDPAGASGIADGSNGNIVGTDPFLVGLTDNGGATPSHRLLSTSPAVNAGDPSASAALTFDQRLGGFPRQLGGGVDLGAFEVLTIDYDAWGDANFTAATPLGLRGTGDDPDGDGLDNGIERIIGSDPEARTPSPFGFTVGESTFSFSFPRVKTVPDDIGAVETSTDLSLWAFPPDAMLVRDNVSATEELVTVTFQKNGEPRFFARLRDTIPPPEN